MSATLAPPPPSAARSAGIIESEGPDAGPTAHVTPADGEPVWPLADLYPRQGDWTEHDFLKLDLMRVELVDGRLEFLPVANRTHQKIVLFLVNLLTALLRPDDRGEVLFAPFKVRVVGGNFREPDIVVMLAANYGRCAEGHWDGADLAIEVVSPDDPGRDYVVKREAYAAAGVREYWIVDPLSRLLTLLVLDGEAYRVAGTYGPGTRATSVLIPDFSVDAREVFDVRSR